MKLEKIEYKFIERNLLEEPEKYFFSEYNGSNFVEAYFYNRLNMIENLINNKSCRIYSNLHEYIQANKLEDFIEAETKIVSLQLLRVLLEGIIKNNIGDKKVYLDMLLKKYEVSKKIFDEYDNEFKSISNKYHNEENYCLLSICCSLYYKQTRNLKYINTAIKINDMLCSKGIKINEDNIFLLNTALNEEAGCVSKLFFLEGFAYDIK